MGPSVLVMSIIRRRITLLTSSTSGASASATSRRQKLAKRVGIMDWGMANPNGNAAALIPALEGNTYALRHGAYSQVGLSERASSNAAPRSAPNRAA